jgi:hypothetical protein
LTSIGLFFERCMDRLPRLDAPGVPLYVAQPA